MMTPLIRLGRELLGWLFVLLAAPTATAVIIRHDRPDSAAVERGAAFPAVGQVVPDGGCTLIAPTWVITAAHVAANIKPDNGKVRFEGHEYSVKRVVLHPDAQVKPGRPPEVDLALVELAEPVPGTAPLEIYRAQDEQGRTITIVGHGDVGDGKSAPRRGDGKRRAATNVVSDAGPRRIFCKFDTPPEGTDLEGVGGPGDSGGPALLEQNGRYLVAGVSSASMEGRPGRYGVVDAYTRVSAYAAWIDATVGENRPKP